MFRRYVFPMLASLVLLVLTGFVAAAQSGPIRGHVTLKQADGTVVPAVNAVVDVFRWDIPGQYELKTSKTGEFQHAGLPAQGTYVISISMPGAEPYYQPNLRPGMADDIKIELTPGDGRRLTRDEIKTLLARGSSGATTSAANSAEEKAKREELIRKNAEITEANKKVEESNAIIDRTFKAGNEALRAKNYDAAIASYDEGLRADPEHPGAPALLTNKTMALTNRAVERYNAAVKSPDDAAKTAGMEAAKKDWTEAAESGTKAVTMLKALAPPTDPAAANSSKVNLYFALLARAEAERLYVVKVDQSKVDDGIAAYQDYIAAEADPVKKAKAEHDLAQMLFDANVFDRALSEYQKILEGSPDDLDALLRAGQALFNIGAINSDKTKYQEAANYLAQFVQKAPDTNPFKADAQAILDTLKDQANVKPEKVTAPPRRTRKP
ncbi:MAG TPA: tetratricopeptide repeat protein [Pyrinomonadaceae bacterium]|nr:tetratricopeptide repeat protein [Pyrinomonadaceae bacterium]